ncbi:LOW QUALITY PROTEIN: NAD_binding_10 domain-containing protein, partial [Cephalotus follicularis]
VILSLIVKRTRVKALVKDKRAAMEAFGTYVESMAGDACDKPFLKKALRGVRAIICPNEGFPYDVWGLKGVQHVILLSQLSVYGNNGIQYFMEGNARRLAEQDESTVIASGIPYTIIRAGMLKNTPGGAQGFSFEEGSVASGSLSKEDAAFICVEALDVVPPKGFILEVVNGEEKVSDWKECLRRLMEKAES